MGFILVLLAIVCYLLILWDYDKTKDSNQNIKTKNYKKIKEENKKKPATTRQEEFLRELIERIDYLLFSEILISDNLISKINMEIASDLISYLLEIEKGKVNKVETKPEFFKKFPELLTEYNKLQAKHNKRKCLGITASKVRCNKNTNFPEYFCNAHIKQEKKYDIKEAIAREYFYRENCQRFVSELFQYLTLESKENNFKLENSINSIIKDYFEASSGFSTESLHEKSFKDLFFDYDYFSMFTAAVFDGSFLFNVPETSIYPLYSDHHLNYEEDYHEEYFDSYGISELLAKIYLFINCLNNEVHQLIEEYYVFVKQFNSELEEVSYQDLENE